MSALLAAYRITGAIVFLALAAVIGIQLATGRINTHGLLRDKTTNGSEAFSPGRAQLLISTLTIATIYVYRVFTSPTGGLPDIPGSALAFVGASHVSYLVGKAVTLLSGRERFPR